MWGRQFASLNKEKTIGMWLGRWRACSDEPVNLKWTNDFQNNCTNTTDTDKRTSRKVISKFAKCVKICSRRRLSFRRKCYLANCGVQLQLVHSIGSFILVPNKVKQIEQISMFVYLEQQTRSFGKRITIKHICEWRS